jgi:predicted dehydrogenase
MGEKILPFAAGQCVKFTIRRGMFMSSKFNPGGNQKARVAIVGGGAGAFFGAAHANALQVHGAGSFTHGCLRSNPVEAVNDPRFIDVMQYASVSTMILQHRDHLGGADYVVIATPNTAHGEQIMEFAEAGWHILCEKPLLDDVRELSVVRKAVEQSGVEFLLENTYAHGSDAMAARALMEGTLSGPFSGRALGDLKQFRGSYCQGWLENNLAAQGQKQAKSRADGKFGCAGDIGWHLLSLLWSITGDELDEVQSRMKTTVPGRTQDDNFTLLGQTRVYGAEVVLTTTQTALGCYNDVGCYANFENGAIRWSIYNPNVLEVMFRGDSGWTTLQLGVDQAFIPEDWKGRFVWMPTVHPIGLDGLVNTHTKMREAIFKNCKLDSSPSNFFMGIEAGARLMQVLEACHASAGDGGRVQMMHYY